MSSRYDGVFDELSECTCEPLSKQEMVFSVTLSLEALVLGQTVYAQVGNLLGHMQSWYVAKADQNSWVMFKGLFNLSEFDLAFSGVESLQE